MGLTVLLSSHSLQILLLIHYSASSVGHWSVWTQLDACGHYQNTNNSNLFSKLGVSSCPREWQMLGASTENWLSYVLRPLANTCLKCLYWCKSSRGAGGNWPEYRISLPVPLRVGQVKLMDSLCVAGLSELWHHWGTSKDIGRL